MGITLACPDWEERIRQGRSLIPAAALGINPAESARAVNIFNKLRLPDVPGTPSFAEAGGEWFREIVGSVLGSIDPASGQRLIRELFLMVPKKNSKTTGSAGLTQLPQFGRFCDADSAGLLDFAGAARICGAK